MYVFLFFFLLIWNLDESMKYETDKFYCFELTYLTLGYRNQEFIVSLKTWKVISG